MKRLAFIDYKGNKLEIRADATIADLLQMGVTEIRLVPKGQPPDRGWWKHEGESCQNQCQDTQKTTKTPQ